MGRTLKAMDRSTGEIVCIKQLHPKIDKRSLKQEFEALSRISHENVVKVLQLFTHDDHPVMIMEFVGGHLLRQLFQFTSRPIRIPEVTGLFHYLFDAISAAHDQQVIHRDLKPENVMLENSVTDLLPKVFDFGLSIVDQFDHRDLETAIDSFAGTTPYMAPEQLKGDILSGACDVYALGQMLWEILHGEPAFKGPRVEVAIAKLKTDGLEVTRDDVTPDFRELVSNCTLLNPNARPLACDVRDWLKTLPIEPLIASTFGLPGTDWPPFNTT